VGRITAEEMYPTTMNTFEFWVILKK
jgi:hypothetical protein